MTGRSRKILFPRENPLKFQFRRQCELKEKSRQHDEAIDSLLTEARLEDSVAKAPSQNPLDLKLDLVFGFRTTTERRDE